MNKMQIRLDLKNEAKKRMRKLNFGDSITNICASEKNPDRLSYFVKYKNQHSRSLRYHLVECTDKKGGFWDAELVVIYPGHLQFDECEKIYAPLHAAHF